LFQKVRKSGTNDTRTRSRVIKKLVVWAAVSFLLALVAGIASKATTVRETPNENAAANNHGAHNLSWPAPQFVIADFDGDLRPDLASVQVENSTAASSTYWIHVRVSGTEREPMSLVAPVGGLTIEARDVNGDHTVDLVLTTAFTERPIAIFLNDGHGGFSRAATNAFPSAFSRSETEIGDDRKQIADTLGAIPPQSHGGIQPVSKDRLLAGIRVRARRSLRAGFVHDPLVGSCAGRAPPIEV
jgi:hypothetical protein